MAGNKAGYRNLLQLVSKAHLEGFYHRPRVDHAWLEEHADGLIALSGCIQGEIPRLLQKGQDRAAATPAQWYKGIFKDGFFLELQRHPKGMPELEGITQGLLTLANKHNIPIVATNDGGEVVPVRQTERGQERDRTAASRAEQALHTDSQRLVVIADIAGIATVADQVITGGTSGASFRMREH